MDIESFRNICNQLRGVTEDVKWGNDLCFCVGEKMFFVIALESIPVHGSFKVKEEQFDSLCEQDGISPAPYLARYKWVSFDNPDRFSPKEWKHYISQSYNLVFSKLPKKTRDEIG